MWKLESAETPEERLTAAKRLEKLGSVKAIPHLIDTFVDAVALNAVWWIDPSTSRLLFYPSREGYAGQVNPTGTYINAIRSLWKRAPTVGRELLQSYLSDQREIVRAVAASVLFSGTDRAQGYVSRERVLSADQLQFEGKRYLPDID